MTVSAAGVLSWDVPPQPPAGDVKAIVSIRDDSGKEILHTVTLSLEKSKPPQLVKNSVVPPQSTRNPVPAPPAIPQRPPATATQPEADGDNQWRWTGPKPVFVRDERGQVGGMLSADKLFLLDADGTPNPDVVAMPQHSLFAGLRPGQIVALALKPTRIEILDRSGKQIRLINLDDAKPIGCALHPHKPICYVALDREVNEMRGLFYAVDEQSGSVTRGDEHLGQGLEVDPSGRFLVASYFKVDLCWRRTCADSGQGSARTRRPTPGASARTIARPRTFARRPSRQRRRCDPPGHPSRICKHGSGVGLRLDRPFDPGALYPQAIDKDGSRSAPSLL